MADTKDYRAEFETMIDIFKNEFGAFTASDYLSCVEVARGAWLSGKVPYNTYLETKHILFNAIDMPSTLVN